MRCWCATRGGFTLLEAVVALAVLLGITALVLPSFAGRADRASREQAVRRVELAVGRAQSLARSEGVVIRVMAREGSGWLDGERVGSAQPPTGAAEVLADLPGGCSIVGAEPAGTDGSDGEADAGVALGWAMPDGSFVSAPEVRLIAGEVEATLAIGAWSGRVTSGAWQARDAGREAR